MEKKTKHRILGALVLVGLIIILLPFFQVSRDLSTETSMIKPPPFPDQAIQVSNDNGIPEASVTTPDTQAQANTNLSQQPDDTITPNQSNITNVTAPDIVGPTSMTPPTTPSDKVEAGKTETSTTNSTDTPDIKSTETISTEVPKTETSTDTRFGDAQAQAPDTEDSSEKVEPIKTSENVKKKHTASKKIVAKKFVSHAFKPQHVPLKSQSALDKNGLFKLKNAAWVIQVGSFKNKTEALRLVNKLRVNGYRAFIQQIHTEYSQSTQVFIGPELKQGLARSLADQLESDMHIRGIVISYKPLALL